MHQYLRRGSEELRSQTSLASVTDSTKDKGDKLESLK